MRLFPNLLRLKAFFPVSSKASGFYFAETKIHKGYTMRYITNSSHDSISHQLGEMPPQQGVKLKAVAEAWTVMCADDHAASFWRCKRRRRPYLHFKVGSESSGQRTQDPPPPPGAPKRRLLFSRHVERRCTGSSSSFVQGSLIVSPNLQTAVKSGQVG